MELYRFTEKPKNTKKLFSEQWKLNFWFHKDDGYWEKRTILYCTEDRDEYDNVIEQWKNDYSTEIRENKVKFINCRYQ